MEWIGGVAVLIPLISIIAPFITGLIIVIVVMRKKQRENELVHEERMLAIQKGIALPPRQAEPERKKNGQYPFAWPFVLIGLGLALIIIYMVEGHRHDPESLGFGLVSLFIGLGLFASRFYGARKEEIVSTEENTAASYTSMMNSNDSLAEAATADEEIKEEE